MSCKTYDPCRSNNLNQVGSYASTAGQYAQQAQQSATNAATSATQASTAQAEAEQYAIQAAASAAISGIYLGAKSTAPVVDNQGNPLQEGMQYFNSVDNTMYVWDGTSWITATGFNETTNFLATGTTTARDLQDRFADVVNVKDFGAVGDGVADDTAAIQDAIDYAITGGGRRHVYVPPGNYSVGPIDLNGRNHPEPPNQQWQSVYGFFGAGRMTTIFTARTGLYSSGDFVITANNTAGTHYGNFRVVGAGVSDSGVDFSWIGGSGSASSAPSNQVVIENIFVEGCSATSFRMKNVYDGNIIGLWARGASPDGYGLDMGSPDDLGGGCKQITNTYVSTGKLRISCQNVIFSGSGFFAGVELSGASYNNILFDSCHFYPNPTTGTIINSTAIGNANQALVFNSCYFNSASNHVIGDARFHTGAQFNGCQFNGYSNGFFGTIQPGSGSGSTPTFAFTHCNFLGGAIPDPVSGQYRISALFCREGVGGLQITNYGIINTSELISTSNGVRVGNSNGYDSYYGQIKSAYGNDIPTGGTVIVPNKNGSYLLNILSYGGISNGNRRKSSIYHVGNINGDGFQAIQLASDDGSAGNVMTFTVTWDGANVVVTNTSVFNAYIRISQLGIF